MHDQQVEVLEPAAACAEHLAGDLGHASDGQLEHRPAVHHRHGLGALDHLAGDEGPALGAAAGHVEDVAVVAVAVEHGAEDAAVAVARLAAPEDHGAAAVAEQHQQVAEPRVPCEILGRQRARVAAVQHLEGACRERHQGGMDVGAHQQHGARDAAADECVHHLQPVGEAGALLADVQHRQRPDAQLLLDERSGARKVVVRGHRGAHHVVELAGLDPGAGQRGAGRLGTEVGGGDSGLHVEARHDAAALADPGVVGLDDARQHVVVDLERRDGDPGPGEHGASRRGHHGGGAALSGMLPGRGT